MKLYLLIQIILLSGCASSKKYNNLSELKMQISELQSANSYSNSKLEELNNRLFVLQEEIEGNRIVISQLFDGVEKNKNIENKSSEKTDEKLQKTAKTKEDSVSLQFNTALGFFNSKKYDSALKAFNDFIKKYPKNKLTPDSIYWVGEIKFDRKMYSEALLEYKKIPEEFPLSSKIDASILKQGFCYLNLEDAEKAKAKFNEVIDLYPNSGSAFIARKQLLGMR